MTILNDNSPMPFGIHKDTPLKDVPADYLVWLYEECDKDWQESYPALERYIEDNWNALEDE